jgi:hypothetical protein
MKTYNLENGITFINIECNHCDKEFVLQVKTEDWLMYVSGSFSLQRCFPYLSAVKRELLISNLCGECFDKLCPVESDFFDDNVPNGED